MASFKKQFMDILMSKYEMRTLELGNRAVPVFSRHFNDIMKDFDYEKIIKSEHLTGKVKPVAIVQYFVYVHGDNEMDSYVPLVAFIWSWGGPWAYVHNMKWPECSESGSVNIQLIKWSANL